MEVYPNPFPDEREALRRHLLDAVDSIADVLAANRDKTEELRTLAPASVEALRDSGLFKLKAPREVGGAEAHPVVQMDVIEAVAMIDPAASWCMLISSAVTGKVLSRVPDETVAEILSGGFPFMAGSLRPGGSARKVDGGYRVSGRWAWGSGVPHADYVAVPVFCDEPPLVHAVVPVSEVELIDTWHVLGMRGTGSGDYELDEVFVPENYVTDMTQLVQPRGGALYRHGMPGYVINEHGCFAYALGRLALKTLTETAIAKKRGYAAGVSLADREVFQRALGSGTTRMNACALVMADAVERLYAAYDHSASAAADPQNELEAEARSAAVWCTDEAIDVVATLFRYAGGSAVMTDNVMQRILRDLYTVQSHLVVSDVAYEDYGRTLITEI